MGALPLYLDFINLFLFSCCASSAIAADERRMTERRRPRLVAGGLLHGKVATSRCSRSAWMK